MLGSDLSKADIEKQTAGKGDFVQIDYLSKLLKEKLRRDTKKFVYLKLIEIYKKKNMLNEAAKMHEGIADISIPFSEQIKNYLKTGQYQEVTKQEIIDTAIKHANLLWQTKGPSAFKEMRKHLLFYVKGHPQATDLRKELVAVDNPKEVEKIFERL